MMFVCFYCYCYQCYICVGRLVGVRCLSGKPKFHTHTQPYTHTGENIFVSNEAKVVSRNKTKQKTRKKQQQQQQQQNLIKRLCSEFGNIYSEKNREKQIGTKNDNNNNNNNQKKIQWYAYTAKKDANHFLNSVQDSRILYTHTHTENILVSVIEVTSNIFCLSNCSSKFSMYVCVCVSLLFCGLLLCNIPLLPLLFNIILSFGENI